MKRTGMHCLGLLALVAAGCNSAEEPTPSESLTVAYAGLDETDEEPIFADPELAKVELTGEDPTVVDATLDGRPEVLENAHHLRVLVTWGRMRPNPEATDPLDWSGDVSVDNGAVRVLRTVRFEQPMDHLLPRDGDIHTVPFVSHTLPSFDGLLLDVVLSPTLNPGAEQPSITFTSGPITYTLPLARDMRRTVVVPVGEAGHHLMFHVFLPDRDGCAEGVLAGLWRQLPDRDGRIGGVMKGRFISESGAVRGVLRGVYGQRDDGARVFFAKIIDHDGRFLGIVFGRYGEGNFGGRFIVRDRVITGVVRGHYFDADRDHDGTFSGRWSQRCGEDEAEGQTSAAEPTIPPLDPTQI